MAKKLELQESDIVYCKALNVLLNNAQLKLHDIEKDDLNQVGHTLNWIANLLPRMVNAPEELTAKDVLENAEKVETSPRARKTK